MTHLSRLLLVALALLSFRSSACLNFYVIDSSGHEHIYNEYPPTDIFLRTDYHIKDLEELGSKIPSVSPDEKYKYISNYCALLIKLGRHKDAMPILEKLLKEKPNEYEIIANLAVAYELNGQIDKAYESLRKSLSLNRLSHGGSEWFHLNILEAAIKLKNGNLKAKDITILKFPRTDPEMVSHQISYQLKERVPLTSATNDLLSKVIEESAEFFGAKISLEWAIEHHDGSS